MRRIQQATGVRRETGSAYLKAAGVEVYRPGWGRRAPAKPAIQVTPDLLGDTYVLSFHQFDGLRKAINTIYANALNEGNNGTSISPQTNSCREGPRSHRTGIKYMNVVPPAPRELTEEEKAAREEQRWAITVGDTELEQHQPG